MPIKQHTYLFFFLILPGRISEIEVHEDPALMRRLALFLGMSWLFSRMGVLGAALTPIHPLSGHGQSLKALWSCLASWLNQPTAGQSCGHGHRDSICTSGNGKGWHSLGHEEEEIGRAHV